MEDKIKSGFKSLFTIGANIVNGVDQTVSEQTKFERRAICESCPKLIKITRQCSECLCFVDLKTTIKQEKCPLDKWKIEE
jgi:hypothetical protein